jgi:phytoene/squalene synthetase
MTPEQFYQTRATPPGSAGYYALYFEDRSVRQALLPIYALDREIADNPLTCHDSDVALKTLDWWQDEISAAYAQRATHPASKALQEALKTYPLAQEYFEELLDAQRQLLINRSLTSQQELGLYYHRSGGTLWSMAAEICGYEERQTHRGIIRLGTSMKQLDSLIRLREYSNQGLVLFPIELMNRHQVSPMDFQHIATTAPIQDLLGDQARQLQETIQNDLASLPQRDRWSLRHLVIQAELGLSLLSALKDIDYQLLDQTVYLTPLQSLWTAWKVKRREKKNMKLILL